jgi:hypothetical protein
MRRAVLAFACAFVAMATAAPAFADNGQLAAVIGGKLVAVNPDGSGLRTLWTPPGGDITGLAWSPDGNKLLFSYGGTIAVQDLATRKVETYPPPPAGAYDVDPGWYQSQTGLRIVFRRVWPDRQQRIRISPVNGIVLTNSVLDATTRTLATAPTRDAYAFALGPLLFWSGLLDFPLVDGAGSTPAWSPDSTRLAYVDTGSVFGGGLNIAGVIGLPTTNVHVTNLPVELPRWSGDGTQLVYLSDGAVRTVAAVKDATPETVPGLANVTAVDWQPCVAATVSCNSILPPTCSTLTGQVTTQADQPVALPPAPCSDPASLPLSFVVVKGPDFGTLNGTVYTPNPGFTGQDAVTYKVSNGSGESDVIRVTIFVVPRSGAAGAPPAAAPAPNVVMAPFLTMRTRPRLDRKRTTIVRLTCDQECSISIRLEGTARVKKKKKTKTFRGVVVKRTLLPGRVLALKLKLPAKPTGKLKTAWITGTVRGPSGVSRAVKLPVGIR